MAKRLGNDRRIWVESATPGTYNMVKGNQTIRVSRSGNTFSIGTKDDFPIDPQAPGLRTVSLACSFIPDLPDATGFTRLASFGTSASPSPVNIQVRAGGASGADPDDVEFECSMYVTQQDSSADANAPVGSDFTLVAAAAPTVDTL